MIDSSPRCAGNREQLCSRTYGMLDRLLEIGCILVRRLDELHIRKPISNLQRQRVEIANHHIWKQARSHEAVYCPVRRYEHVGIVAEPTQQIDGRSLAIR